MVFDAAERAFVDCARVGRLATVRPSGEPHIVPICFACVDGTIVSPIDAKPKRVAATELQRVKNIVATPAVSLLLDRYVADWSRLAWVRIDGSARLEPAESELHSKRVEALLEKYEQYHDHPLAEQPMLVIEPERVRSWGASSHE